MGSGRITCRSRIECRRPWTHLIDQCRNRSRKDLILGAEADYGIEPGFARKQDKFTTYAVASAWQAVQQSGLDSGEGENINPLRFGVYVGSGIGGLQTMIRETEKMISEGTKWVSPLFIPTMISNIAAGNIARCCRCS